MRAARRGKRAERNDEAVGGALLLLRARVERRLLLDAAETFERTLPRLALQAVPREVVRERRPTPDHRLDRLPRDLEHPRGVVVVRRKRGFASFFLFSAAAFSAAFFAAAAARDHHGRLAPRPVHEASVPERVPGAVRRDDPRFPRLGRVAAAVDAPARLDQRLELAPQHDEHAPPTSPWRRNASPARAPPGRAEPRGTRGGGGASASVRALSGEGAAETSAGSSRIANAPGGTRLLLTSAGARFFSRRLRPRRRRPRPSRRRPGPGSRLPPADAEAPSSSRARARSRRRGATAPRRRRSASPRSPRGETPTARRRRARRAKEKETETETKTPSSSASRAPLRDPRDRP